MGHFRVCEKRDTLSGAAFRLGASHSRKRDLAGYHLPNSKVTYCQNRAERYPKALKPNG
jgi:hypothetical protein